MAVVPAAVVPALQGNQNVLVKFKAWGIRAAEDRFNVVIS